jgi:Tol biopolymer transport system component
MLASGSRLGGYEIRSLLGAGGMGEVYRARDPGLERDVAIKVLPSDISEDSDRLKRFEREARAASSLNHPSIVTIHEVGRDGPTSYIVMELVEGETVRALLSEGAVPLRKLLSIAAQAADGLAKAHAAGVVHRDLKPENLIVTPDGFAKILDFGLAKLTEREPTAKEGTQNPTASVGTAPGIVMGTPSYMSPEQASGRAVDFRSDMFSLGAIVYEMATGKKPFGGTTAVETLAAILRDEPQPITQVNPRLPAPLSWLAQRCLSKDPAERYASTRDLARQLQDMRDHLSEASAIGAAGEAPTRTRRRVPAWAPLLAVPLALALALLIGPSLRRAPIPSFRRLTFRRGEIEGVRFAPDGQSVVYSAAWEGRPAEIFLTRPESPEGRPLGLASAHLASVSVGGELAVLLARGSPLVGTEQNVLARTPLGGGEPREVAENVTCADWAPDGKSLAVVHNARDGSSLEYPVGRVLLKTAGYLTHMRVSPKGDLVAFIEHLSSGSPRGAVWVVDSSGNKKALTKIWSVVWGLAFSPPGDEVWFSARDENAAYAVYAVTLSGRQRLVARAPADLLLEDVFRDGRALLKRVTGTAETLGLLHGATREENLSWLDRSTLADLSTDGTSLLYNKMGEGGGAFYLRRSNATAPVRLGDGTARSLSPDGRWVLATQGTPVEATLVPTGAGEPRRLSRDGLEYRQGFAPAHWLPDSTHVLLAGHQGEKPWRCYELGIDGSEPRPVTADGTKCGPTSPDGKLVITSDGRIFPLEPASGLELRRLPGFAFPADSPVQWSADGGSIYVRNDTAGLPCRIDRLDLKTGRRELWKDLRPSDPAGVSGIENVAVTRDGSAYAYQYNRFLGDLYLVEGLR